jgi:hypothetical protein
MVPCKPKHGSISILFCIVMKMGKSKSMSVVYKTKTGMKDKTPVKCDDDDVML